MKKVLFNYFEFEAFLKEIKDLAEKDPAVAPLFRALQDQINREQFLCRADRGNRCVFGNQRLSPAVKSRYYQVQKAFKDFYRWSSTPDV